MAWIARETRLASFCTVGHSIFALLAGIWAERSPRGSTHDGSEPKPLGKRKLDTVAL